MSSFGSHSEVAAMRPLRVYIESSVYGFLLDDSEANRGKRDVTVRLFEQVRQGRLMGWASEAVLGELVRTPDVARRELLLRVANSLDMLPDPDPDELNFLVERYMSHGAFPADKRDDALHVALVVLNPHIDAMLSWNCRHLANENNRRRLKALTLGEGYPFGFDIITPEEAIVYD